MLRWLSIGLIFINSFGLAQTVLDRQVHCEIKNETLEEAIDQLSDIAQFDYSYRRGVIQSDKIVTVLSYDKTVKEILDQIIADKAVQYEIVGSQIIFVQHDEVVVRRTYNVLTGYVRDAETGVPIASAFIVDSTLRIAAQTDENGYYELLVPNPDYTLGIHCIAENYENKDLKLKLNADKELNLKLESEEKWKYVEPITFRKEPAFIDVEDRTLVKMVLPKDTSSKKSWLTTFNIEAIDLNLKGVKLGLIPSLSTDLSRDAHSINKVSLNALIGYSAGTEGVEIGGLMNVNRYNMKGVQISGIGNNVGGSVQGVQISGIYNFNGLGTKGTQLSGVANVTMLGVEGVQISGFVNANNGPVDGVQLTGFTNLNNGSMEGAQASGFLNINNGEMTGFQASGYVNINRGYLDGSQFSGYLNVSMGEMEGIQGTGFLNIAKGSMNGTQLAGVGNFASGDVSGFQLSGAMNITSGELEGGQVAGITNIHLGTLNGTQISGFLNHADTLRRGLMLAPINICDTVEDGAVLGFLSFVKTGVHSLEIEQGSDMITNLNFRTGVPKFYNIISLGANFNDRFYHIGYGVGSAVYLGKKKRSHMDVDFDWHNRFDNQGFHLDQTVRSKATVAVRLFDAFELFAGGAFNFRYWREDHSDYVAMGGELPPLENEWFATVVAGIRI